MKNYGIPGGIMWSVFRNQRYAWKELKSTGFWPEGTDPDNTLSGRDLVRAFDRFSATWPEAQLRNPPTPDASPESMKVLLADTAVSQQSFKEAVK
jgi:hypothetical protein